MNNKEFFNSSSSLVPDIAKCFAIVFAGHPWFEVSKCNKCGRYSSTLPEQSVGCNYCTEGICDLEAYPLEETIAYVRGQLGRPNSVGIASVSASGSEVSKIEGFSWGYGETNQSFSSDIYKTPEMQQLIFELLRDLNIFFYVSEVGVKEELRGKGLGKTLTIETIQRSSPVYSSVVLVTNENSGMRHIAESIGMKPLLGLNTGIKDKENEARILFVGQK